MSKQEKYLELANNLCRSAEIAIESIQKYPDKNWKDEFTKKTGIDFYLKCKKIIEHAEPKFQSMSSLKYDYEAIFTYFQESSGIDVDYFWKKIKENNLPFKRENRLAKILKRKKIKDDIEFDFVTDVIVPYLQEGLINEEESILLKQYIGDFELRNKGK